MDTINLKVWHINKRLVKARNEAGLSQSEVAKALGLKGTASSISDIETGKNALTVERLLRLAKLYNVDMTWLMTGFNPNYNYAVYSDMDNKIGEMTERYNDDLDTLASLLAKLTEDTEL